MPPVIRRSAGVVATLLLVGCVGVSPSSLKPSARAGEVQLADRFVYQTSGGLGPVRIEHALVAGPYRALAEDAEGTYHHGPRGCYSIKVLDPGLALREETRGKVLRHQDCGIYIPNDAAQPPRIYVVLGSDTPAPPAPAPGAAEAALTNVVVPPTAGRTTQMQGAIGAGIGVGIASALADAEKGNFNFIQQPQGNVLRQAFTAHR